MAELRRRRRDAPRPCAGTGTTGDAHGNRDQLATRGDNVARRLNTRRLARVDRHHRGCRLGVTPLPSKPVPGTVSTAHSGPAASSVHSLVPTPRGRRH